MTDEIRQLEEQVRTLKTQVARARQAAPREAVGDYAFRRPDGAPVSLRELFGDKRELLVVHNMGERCVYCTMWADGFNGVWRHVADRAAFVVSSPDEPAEMKRFAESRGWGFPMVSVRGTGFARDMGFEPKAGEFWPGVSAFHLAPDGGIVRTGKTPLGPGDDFCAVWPLLELVEGGAKDWAPKYRYGESQ